jgi:catechol 2,3-dioxygenase-like lactoylglutathione lyase family enzyme
MSVELPVMHVGSHVPDLDAAIAEYSGMGADLWHRTPSPLELYSFDADAGTVAPVQLHVALGRLAGSLMIELIEPIGSGTSGHPGLLARSRGVSHVGSWCSDLPAAYRTLVASGARLLLASSADPAPIERLRAAATEDDAAAALGQLTTCYLELASGTRLELIHTSMFTMAYPALAPGLVGVMRPPPSA